MIGIEFPFSFPAERSALGRLLYISGFVAALLTLHVETAFPQTATWETKYDSGIQAFADRRYSDAEHYYQSALSDAQSFDETDPRLAETIYRLGILYYAQRRYEDAEPLLQRAVELRRGKSPTHQPELAKSMLKLAELYRATQGLTAADAMYRQALSVAQDSPDADGTVIAKIHLELGLLYSSDSRVPDAKNEFQ